MAKQTAAQRREAEELARQERRAEAERFMREQAPMLLLALMARAQQLDVNYTLRGPIENLNVTFKFDRYDDQQEHWVNEEEVYLSSEPWVFENVDSLFNGIVREREEKARKLELARATYDKLNPEEREALGLKYRP